MLSRLLQLSNGQLAVVKEVTDEVSQPCKLPCCVRVDVSGQVVILDGNHPLAGKPLNFEVELFEIKVWFAVLQFEWVTRVSG